MKIALPGQAVQVDTPAGVEPTWYQRLTQIATAINSGAIGGGALAAAAVAGFGFLPTCAGAPTGVPLPPPGTRKGTTLAQAGFAPVVFDTTNNKLWIFNNVTGVWKGIVLT
jgi:hypothetical protein